MQSASFDPSHKIAYIKISDISTGDYRCSDESQLVLFVGPRTAFKAPRIPDVDIQEAEEVQEEILHEDEYKFSTRNRNYVDHLWKFHFKAEDHASFVVVLYKHHFLGDSEIGEIELKLKAFQPNTVVSDVFTLLGPNKDWEPAKLRITVHIDENGAQPFSAPEGMFFSDDAEIKHEKTYGTFAKPEIL